MHFRAITLFAFLYLGLAFLSAVSQAEPPVGKPVSFPEREYSLAQAVEQFELVTGTKIDISRADSQVRTKFGFENESFWVALERLSREFDSRIVFSDNGRKPALIGNEQTTYKQLPQSLDNLFALKVKRVQGIRDLESDKALCELSLEFHWLPTMHVFMIEQPGGNVTAKDNAGKPLTVADPGRARVASSGGGNQLTLRLEDVPRSVRSIKEVVGSFTVVGTTSFQEFTFDNLGDKKPQEQAANGIRVQLVTDMKVASAKKPKKDDDDDDQLWTAKVQITNPPDGPEFESFENGAWTIENEAILVSKDGKQRLSCNGGTEMDTPSERQARITYRFVAQDNLKLGKPADWKLLIRTPGKLQEWPVKFKLENIELP